MFACSLLVSSWLRGWWRLEGLHWTLNEPFQLRSHHDRIMSPVPRSWTASGLSRLRTRYAAPFLGWLIQPPWKQGPQGLHYAAPCLGWLIQPPWNIHRAHFLTPSHKRNQLQCKQMCKQVHGRCRTYPTFLFVSNIFRFSQHF